MEYTSDIQDLIDDFAFLDDWEDRYTHVIELGKALSPLSDTEKCDDTKVKGCVSQVWLIAHTQKNDRTILIFRGDSDAHIVKGLVAIMLKIYSGKTPDEILALDIEDIILQLGLEEHLSPQRANGLKA
ncbi:MAG TPA: SufE family protein, partial [Hellea balneolensis]|nr:SufE family protein [Hellea balneolensis]